MSYSNQRYQTKNQEEEKRNTEAGKEAIEAYKLAAESLYTYLDVVQQGFVEDILDNADWQLKEQLARIEYRYCIASLRMLGENEIANGCARVIDYIREKEGQKLKEEWEGVILDKYVYPLLEKVNQRLKSYK